MEFYSSSSLILVLFLVLVSTASSAMEEDCVFSAVKRVVEGAIYVEAYMGASLVRLHFHDCFVDGCDGGVLRKGTVSFSGEQTARPNFNSARGFAVIDKAKEAVVSSCPGLDVSCADIFAIAARDSVVKLGGVPYDVKLGRRDARKANFDGANDQLVGPGKDLDSQTAKFSAKGFNQTEMVALVGAHTLGFSRCAVLCAAGNPTIIPTLPCNCSSTVAGNQTVGLDPTPARFDTDYFQQVAQGKGVFFSDDQLLFGHETSAAVLRYKDTPAMFSREFAEVILKMGNLPHSGGAELEIRRVCSRVNAWPVKN